MMLVTQNAVCNKVYTNLLTHNTLTHLNSIPSDRRRSSQPPRKIQQGTSKELSRVS